MARVFANTMVTALCPRQSNKDERLKQSNTEELMKTDHHHEDLITWDDIAGPQPHVLHSTLQPLQPRPSLQLQQSHQKPGTRDEQTTPSFDPLSIPAHVHLENSIEADLLNSFENLPSQEQQAIIDRLDYVKCKLQVSKEPPSTSLSRPTTNDTNTLFLAPPSITSTVNPTTQRAVVPADLGMFKRVNNGGNIQGARSKQRNGCIFPDLDGVLEVVTSADGD